VHRIDLRVHASTGALGHRAAAERTHAIRANLSRDALLAAATAVERIAGRVDASRTAAIELGEIAHGFAHSADARLSDGADRTARAAILRIGRRVGHAGVAVAAGITRLFARARRERVGRNESHEAKAKDRFS
jgi:hypothetical protein